ncbi:lipopolysaccharide transport periplasmic protein LptA [Allosediminivita pacifica]|uniref:Lipopolysaccharide export system protein LptA n=1 Tax=Allosediminivita pacifica TaxID=1267769 RepID=A0A2T6B436_9RHOB|nr:lipopolysaccharide transport periplasmic protein LptA [Allosediminivita pacifica]PTX50840.1 lipopolysaccharide export system protein LptA [Allosediminivita pacifica]GGB01583.1 organic solvent tolerance protein OstA [Allosediminivita pacifica]
MKRFAVLIAAALAVAGPVFAQGAQVAFGDMQQSTDAPVEVSADELRVNQSDGTAVYTGNVVIGQGDMRLSAPRVTVVYVEGQGRIERLEARGGVTLVSGEEAAEAEEADYDINGGSIVMRGDVLLTQGGNALMAESMTVDLNAGTAQMSGRVRTVIDQGSNADGAN